MRKRVNVDTAISNRISDMGDTSPAQPGLIAMQVLNCAAVKPSLRLSRSPSASSLRCVSQNNVVPSAIDHDPYLERQLRHVHFASLSNQKPSSPRLRRSW